MAHYFCHNINFRAMYRSKEVCFMVQILEKINDTMGYLKAIYDGSKSCLRIEEYRTHSQGGKSEKVTEKTFPCETESFTKEQILQLRLQMPDNEAMVIVKSPLHLDDFAIGRVPLNGLSVRLENPGIHLCPECMYCHALGSFENGGCPKVSDSDGLFWVRMGHLPIKESVCRSKRLEKYPFITAGAELFSYRQLGQLIVAGCKMYKKGR